MADNDIEEMGGGWPEWRRLVLGDLKRIDLTVRELDKALRRVASDVRVIKAEQEDHQDLETRVAALEAQAKAEASAGTKKNEDRKWLIGLGVLIVASILLPSLRAAIWGVT